MDTRELIEAFRQQLAEVEAKGSTEVKVAALRAYLAALERDATMSSDQRKLEHAGMLAHYAAENEFNLEMLKAVLEAGKSGLQALLIINGGAVIALLGVLSNLVDRPEGTTLARYLALPLLEFGIGVLCGAVGFAFRYFSQACYAESSSDKDAHKSWGDRLRHAAIASGIAGYVLFGVALVNSYHAVIWSFAP